MTAHQPMKEQRRQRRQQSDKILREHFVLKFAIQRSGDAQIEPTAVMLAMLSANHLKSISPKILKPALKYITISCRNVQAWRT
jgi:hypothetical protein